MLRAVAASVAGEGSSQSQFNSSAFASLPAAASSTGMIYAVTDFPGSPLFKSNGTRWFPVGGSVVTYQKSGSLAAPLATITASTAAQFSIAGGFPVIPAGILAAHSMVRVTGFIRKNGANATAVASVRMGTAGTTGDSAILGNTITNVDNRQFWFFADTFFSSATVFDAPGFMVPNNFQTAAIVDRTTNVNTAAAMTISLDISSANASDSFDLVSLQVVLFP